MRANVNMTGRVTLATPPILDFGPLVEMPVVRGRLPTPEKVAVVDVDGLLVNYNLVGLNSLGDNPIAIFREKLDRIASDRCYRAVVLRINSHGGGVTASDIMANDLQRFKSQTGLPVVASLLDIGTGGAYYLACGADVIVAHPTSITGGVGVILNLYNLQDTMAQFQVVGIPIKSGEFIDTGTPIKPTIEQREILQRMADEFHQRFRHRVQSTRTSVNPHDATLLDGRVFTAQQALDQRLIDGIGYLDDAIQLAAEMGGVPGARAVILHRCVDKARTEYAVSPNSPLQGSGILPLSIPGMDRSRLPTFLYMWQPEPTMERLGGR